MSSRYLFPRLETAGDEVALRVGADQVTSIELAEATAALRVRLANLGFSAPARIAVWTQGSIETAVALVALAAAGFELVPIDPRLGTLELSHLIQDAQPAVAFAADLRA